MLFDSVCPGPIDSVAYLFECSKAEFSGFFLIRERSIKEQVLKRAKPSRLSATSDQLLRDTMKA